MPTFNITAPDGRKFKVTGDNQEGALSALRQHLGDGGAQLGAVTADDARKELARRELQRRQTASGSTSNLTRESNQTAPWQNDPISARPAAPWDSDPLSHAPGAEAKTYDMGELERALRNADAAGDTQAARTIADQIRLQRETSGSGEKVQPQAQENGSWTQFAKAGAEQPAIKRYEVDIDGKRYEMEAPNEEALMKAVDQLAATQRGASADGGLSANNVVRSVATGVPVLGGALNKMNAATNAALAPLLNPLFSDENQLKGDTWEERYNRSLATQEGMDNAYEAQHPVLAGAGHVTGAVAGTLPLIMAAPGAMGAGGGSLLARTAASTASGAVLGGADSAVRSGGNMNETLKGVGFGAAGGVLAPLVGQAVGSGLKAARNGIANMATRAEAGLNRSAANHLSKSLAADGLTAAEAATKLQTLGPEGMIADLGPTLQGDAAALANIPGRAKEMVRAALNARASGANARLAEGINSTIGPSLVPSQVENGIEAAQKSLGPLYDEALKGAKAVDMADVANALESQIANLRGPAQKAVRQVRGMLDIPNAPGNLDPHPGAALQVRHAIDGILKTEADPNAVRALTLARQQVDAKLAQSVPGIKAVDAQYEELARQSKAFNAGRSALDSGKTSPHPLDVERAFQEGALPEGVLVGPSAGPTRYAQGMRAEIDRILGGNANDVATLNRILKSDGDWNPKKLATAFGPEKADKLLAVLEREKLFASTRDGAVGNSVTAARQEAMHRLGAGKSAFGMRQAYEAGGMLGLGRSAALRATDRATEAFMNRIKDASRTKIAGAVVDNRRKVIEALMEIDARKATRALPSPAAQALFMSTGQRR